MMIRSMKAWMGVALVVMSVATVAGQGVLGAGQQPAPQKDMGPETTTATFGDWMLRCQAIAEKPGQRTCEVEQRIIVQGQSAPIAQVAFGRLSPNEPLYVTAVLPTNVTFPSMVRISIDEKDDKPVDVAWTRCLQTGCFASLAMTDAILARWRSQDGPGRLTFKNGAGQDTVLPISFRGLARALDALGKNQPRPAQ